MPPQSIMDFLKELSVGYKAAKSYPPTHPIMAKTISTTLNQLNRLMAEYPEFSMYFLEQTIIFQDLRIDVERNFALLALMDTLKKIEINSLSFYAGISPNDVKNLYEVISAAKLKIKEYGDTSTMLASKGTESIKINAVKFGVQGGQATVQVTTKAAPEVTAALKTEEDFIKEIKNLKSLVDQGVSHLTIKERLDQASDLLSQAPPDTMKAQGAEAAKVLESLSSQQRLEILQGLELKPFALKLISSLDDETLVKFLAARAAGQETGDLRQIIKAIPETKLTAVLPDLKTIIPNIYEYLAEVGLLLSEKVTSLISKEELRMSISPYYAMLENQNSRLREEGLKSLLTLAQRFILQNYTELTTEAAGAIAGALEKETVDEVIIKILPPLQEFHRICREQGQTRCAEIVLEPFTRILGRPGLSLHFKKLCINFLGETRNPAVLPTLFTFLWETGIYPEARAALIQHGKDVIPEILSTLKEAEDVSFRTKLVDIVKNIGKDGIDILINHLPASEWYVKRSIIAILGEIGDPGVLPAIEYILGDPDDRVRLELVRTMSRMEYEEGLLRALNDISMEIKADALRGLRKRIAAEKVRELIPLLKEKGDALHLELLKILAERKTVEAGNDIADYLRTLENREDETAQALKELCVTTMVRIRFPDVKDRLEEFLASKDKTLVELVKFALKRIAE